MLGRGETVPRHHRVFAAVALGILARDEVTPWTAALTEGLNYRAVTATMSDRGLGVLDSY